MEWNFGDFSGDSEEIQQRSSGYSAEIQRCTQQLTKIMNFVVVKEKIRKIRIGVVLVLLGLIEIVPMILMIEEVEGW